MVCPYVYQYEDTSSRCIFYNLSPSIHILFRKLLYVLGVSVNMKKKNIFQMYCVFYIMFIFCFLKLQIVWKQGWQHPSEAPEKKLWEDKRAKWTELASKYSAIKESKRKKTYNRHPWNFHKIYFKVFVAWLTDQQTK